MNSRKLAFLLAASLLFGGAINTAIADSMDDEQGESTISAKYSLKGNGMYRDAVSGLMCVDVYMGTGGTQDGALEFAKREIKRYAKQHKHKSYSVIMSENITPSKYTFYVSYE